MGVVARGGVQQDLAFFKFIHSCIPLWVCCRCYTRLCLLDVAADWGVDAREAGAEAALPSVGCKGRPRLVVMACLGSMP